MKNLMRIMDVSIRINDFKELTVEDQKEYIKECFRSTMVRVASLNGVDLSECSDFEEVLIRSFDSISNSSSKYYFSDRIMKHLINAMGIMQDKMIEHKNVLPVSSASKPMYSFDTDGNLVSVFTAKRKIKIEDTIDVIRFMDNKFMMEVSSKKSLHI